MQPHTRPPSRAGDAGGRAASAHAGTAPPRSRAGLARALARFMFHAHLWIGLLTTGVVLVLCVTGVALNHKRGLGLMPEVDHRPSGAFADALPLAALVDAAGRAAGSAVARAGVDRMDVRPGDGFVKVRFDDSAVTEVTLDLNTGRVLDIGERNDVFLERLHSGEVFGGPWVLLSDVAAAGLAVLILSGYWLWLYPRVRR